MVAHSLPSPPSEDSKSSNSPPASTMNRKSTGSNTKPVKGTNRASKRAGSGAAAVHHHEQVTHGMDGRHKRVWKACERCRMKKTKCDGEFPCKRCKDDGLVCTAGVRKKMEYKQLPRGYAEVLENTQFALIATVHKLYQMVRTNQSWDLGEPELNDRGQPVIHNIAQKLGCIRPNSDIDLPVHSIFPENTQDLEELARQLNEHHADAQHKDRDADMDGDSPSAYHRRTDRASSSDLDHSDIEPVDYRRAAFGSHNNTGSQTLTMSPQSYAGSSTEFEFSQSAPSDLDASAALFNTANSPQLPMFPDWALKTAASGDVAAMQYFQQAMHMGQPMMDGYETIKPQALSNPGGVMMGMNDPLLYSTYDVDLVPI
ncbi:N-terminal fungal transcription regulatory domain-containing protein [Trichoderma citrinoviride]|uniref:N-terminal fungal transcription regulatory domain-containing protein n=1 Tax=Trichoderma citrinoviride TaxID=58853 RepID=A0A2T4BGJ1_9HYPO|nr:N-terminal fungal transcription regulatory domain-containing protein [Trichoderma citrinoviride]PTB68349.1 N-terminal fungal transcription regulatory domain-containing protein [Trichoderma citrinoviride]